MTESIPDRTTWLLPDGPATYAGSCRLLAWGQKSGTGMWVDVNLGVPTAAGQHPFRGIPTGRELGQRFRIVVTFPTEDHSEAMIVHSGEVILLKWSENDRSGMWVRFLLDDGPDGEAGVHPYSGLAVGRRGEILDLRAYAIADDESLVPPSRIRRRTPFDQLSEVQQSQILCRDPRFQGFMADVIASRYPPGPERQAIESLKSAPLQFATVAVRQVLGVPSRSIMNQEGPEALRARTRWRTLMGEFEDRMYGSRRWSAPKTVAKS